MDYNLEDEDSSAGMDMKCGEIFLSASKSLMFLCTLCELKIDTFQEYVDHIMDKHILLNIVDEKPTIKTETDSVVSAEEYSNLEELNELEEVEDVYQLIEEIEVLDPDDIKEESREVEPKFAPIVKTVYANPIPRFTLTAKSVKEQIYNCGKNASKTAKKRYRCWECDKEFRSKKGYSVHSSLHPGERKYHCDRDNCTESFISFRAYKQHMERCTKGKCPFQKQCLECGLHFKNKDAFKQHMDTHSKPFQCKKCNVHLKTVQGLERHMLSHDSRQEIICQLCSMSFNNQSDLLQHMKNTHSGTSQLRVYIRQS